MMPSISACASASLPISAGAMVSLTAATAFVTPLPRYRDLSPSRSSSASRLPVDAPDGAAARPITPDSKYTSASTVGFPRESKISRPIMRLIFAMFFPQQLNGVQRERAPLLLEISDFLSGIFLPQQRNQ